MRSQGNQPIVGINRIALLSGRGLDDKDFQRSIDLIDVCANICVGGCLEQDSLANGIEAAWTCWNVNEGDTPMSPARAIEPAKRHPRETLIALSSMKGSKLSERVNGVPTRRVTLSLLSCVEI